jgi:nucleotide-binding universal stress UspA family protein
MRGVFLKKEVDMFKKIMVPLDGSELAECVLPHVESFMRDCQINTIVFVRVVEPAPVAYRGVPETGDLDYGKIQENSKMIEEERKSNAEKYLKEVVNRLKQNEVEFKTEVLIGKAADSLIDYSEVNDIDLIIMATHGRSGIGRWIRGSIAERILRASLAPVLMVRAPGTMDKRKD